jgi:hypothetical protein
MYALFGSVACLSGRLHDTGQLAYMELPATALELQFLTNSDALAVHANGTAVRPFDMSEPGIHCPMGIPQELLCDAHLYAPPRPDR